MRSSLQMPTQVFLCLFDIFFVFVVITRWGFITCKYTGFDIKNAFVTLYHRIRADPNFKESTILYLIENNFGNDHNWLYGITQKTDTFNNVYVLSEKPEYKIGFCTTEISKIQGYNILRSYASMSGIVFYRQLITINAAHSNGPVAMRALLIEQIAQLKIYTMRTGIQTKMVITGILDENKKRLALNDDVVVAFIILLLNATRFFKKQLNCPYDHIYRLNRKITRMDERVEYYVKNMEQARQDDDNQLELFRTTGMFSSVTAAGAASTKKQYNIKST